MVRAAIILTLGLIVQSCSDEGPSSGGTQLSETQQLCLFTATAMIDLAQQAVDDPDSRPERRESRRLLLEDWVARLAAGEDPCAVNEAIGQSSTTF